MFCSNGTTTPTIAIETTPSAAPVVLGSVDEGRTTTEDETLTTTDREGGGEASMMGTEVRTLVRWG